MSAPAVTILSDLAEGMIDAALGRVDEGGLRSFDVALERYRSAGALGALARVRAVVTADRADVAAREVLVRLDRDLLLGLSGPD